MLLLAQCLNLFSDSDLWFDVLLQDGVDKLAEEGPHRDEDRVQPLGTLLSMRSQDARVAKGLQKN